MTCTKCNKCNNNMDLLMEYKPEVYTYYCPNCFMTVDIVNGKMLTNCHPTMAIEGVLYKIASKIPVSVFEDKSISKDTFLKILLDKKKKESLKDLIK